jgi:hypothetical protein
MGTGGGLIVIDFTDQGNSAHFRHGGWSDQELDRVWAIGPRSVLRIPIQPSGRSLLLEAEIGPAKAPPSISGQIVRIHVNGTAIGSVRLDTRSMIRCAIDPELVGEAGIVELEFEFPGFFRPDSLQILNDNRPLSGWFSFVRLYTMDLFRPGPHFPTSAPDIPVVGLSPPLDEPPGGHAEAAPAAYTFGPGGTALPFARHGWGLGENGLARIVASPAEIELPAPTIPGPWLLRVDLTPTGAPGSARPRNVTIVLDRIMVAQFRVDEPTTRLVPLPRELTDGCDCLKLSFLPRDAGERDDPGRAAEPGIPAIAISRIGILPLPAWLSSIGNGWADAARNVPSTAVSSQFLSEDAAGLPDAIEAALGLDTLALTRGFESLGDNCEFGVIQRKLGLDVVNLFRFGKNNLVDLVRALTDDLRAVADPEAITVELNDAGRPEYVASIPAYNLHWHTSSHEHEAGQPAVWRDHAASLGYLRRKFFEGLRAGRKIYVVKQQPPVPVDHALALLLELTRHGRATVLCVEPAPSGRRPGEVEMVLPGLMRGYVERFAPDEDVGSADTTDWLRVIGNAALLNRGTALSAGP